MFFSLIYIFTMFFEVVLVWVGVLALKYNQNHSSQKHIKDFDNVESQTNNKK